MPQPRSSSRGPDRQEAQGGQSAARGTPAVALTTPADEEVRLIDLVATGHANVLQVISYGLRLQNDSTSQTTGWRTGSALLQARLAQRNDYFFGSEGNMHVAIAFFRALSLMLTGQNPLEWCRVEARSFMEEGLTNEDFCLVFLGLSRHAHQPHWRELVARLAAQMAARPGWGARATTPTDLVKLVATNQASMLQVLSFGMRLHSDPSFRQEIMEREQTYHSEGKYAMSVLLRCLASMILPNNEGAEANPLAAYPPWSQHNIRQALLDRNLHLLQPVHFKWLLSAEERAHAAQPAAPARQAAQPTETAQVEGAAQADHDHVGWQIFRVRHSDGEAGQARAGIDCNTQIHVAQIEVRNPRAGRADAPPRTTARMSSVVTTGSTIREVTPAPTTHASSASVPGLKIRRDPSGQAAAHRAAPAPGNAAVPQAVAPVQGTAVAGPKSTSGDSKPGQSLERSAAARLASKPPQPASSAGVTEDNPPTSLPTRTLPRSASTKRAIERVERPAKAPSRRRL